MVQTSESLKQVFFGHQAYQKLNTLINTKNYSKIFILVDDNTNRDCLHIFQEQIDFHISEHHILQVKQGEINKTIHTCMYLWEILSEKGADRKCLLLNLGGGVVTDMGGFVASTFKRGVDFVNIPTSLLSMVDASVGGKTGVDLGLLKNQVGVFSEPKMVVIDSNYLKTLPDREIKSGWAEMYKHGLIADYNYWNRLVAETNYLPQHIETHIETSVKLKSNIVRQDFREGGVRKVLNFGHTLGHAIESFRLNQGHEHLLHGEAIGIGMILEAFLSHKILKLPIEDVQDIKEVFLTIYKKTYFTDRCIKAIKMLLLHDKKNSYGSISFVLLKRIGEAKIDINADEALIDEAFNYYHKD